MSHDEVTMSPDNLYRTKHRTQEERIYGRPEEATEMTPNDDRAKDNQNHGRSQQRAVRGYGGASKVAEAVTSTT